MRLLTKTLLINRSSAQLVFLLDNGIDVWVILERHWCLESNRRIETKPAPTQ